MKKLLHDFIFKEKRSAYSLVITRYLILLLMLFPVVTVSAQLLSRNPADYPGGKVLQSDIIILKPYQQGVNYLFLLPFVNNGERVHTSYTYTFDQNCLPPGPATPHDSVIVISGIPPCQMLRTTDTLRLTVDLDYNFNSISKQDHVNILIPISHTAVKVAFVLDESGSMGELANGAVDSRWTVLKKATFNFAQNLKVFNVLNDSASFAYFSTNVISPTFGNKFFPSKSTYLPGSKSLDTLILDDMNSRGPLMTTAIGKGLLDAKAKLQHNSSGVRKIVLLFTDGLQNVAPMVDAGGSTLAGGTMFLNDNVPSVDSIAYYTIGVLQTTGAPVAILEAIASSNHGMNLSTSTGEDFQDFFDFQLQHMFSGFSPQLVFQQSGKTAAETIITFTLNASIQKLLVRLNHNEGQSLNLSLEKGGIDITANAKKWEGPFYESLVLNFPASDDSLTGSLGHYKIHIFGGTNLDYKLVCFADDHATKFVNKVGKTINTVGEELPIETRLSYNGLPLTDPSNKVTAIVLKPGEDLGHLLAITQSDVARPDSDIVNGAEQKLLNLLRSDTAFYNRLLSEKKIVELSSPGNGLFSRKFNQTELAGIYKIYFNIKATIPGKGNLERMDLLQVLFEFGKVSEANTPASVQHDTAKHTVVITIRPINKFGKYLGPGYSHRFAVTKLDPGKGESGLHKVELIYDKLDGSYAITLTNIAAGDNPVVKVTVNGETLRNRKLSDFAKTCYPVNCWLIILLIIAVLLAILRYLVRRGIFGKIPQWIILFLVILIILLWLLRWLGIIIPCA